MKASLDIFRDDLEDIAGLRLNRFDAAKAAEQAIYQVIQQHGHEALELALVVLGEWWHKSRPPMIGQSPEVAYKNIADQYVLQAMQASARWFASGGS